MVNHRRLGVSLQDQQADFCVWAPFAEQVAVATPYVSYDLSNQIAMKRDSHGYWHVKIDGVEAGQSYKFLITTKDGTILERNDPRGRALTSSENGTSLIVRDEFEWTDHDFTPAPKETQIIYEMHIGTFDRKDPATPGTFYDAIERLDYLHDLGITMIELMPVTSMAYANGWGYNTSALFSIEPSYGGRRGLMEFINAAHSKSIGVMIDVVYNHFFPDSDLWQFDGWHEGDYGGIYFYNDERGDTPWGGRPDYGRPEVREFILDNVRMWLEEFHADGLRLDSTGYMRNTQAQENDPTHDIADAWKLLQDITTHAHKLNPRALIVAEDTANNEYITKSRDAGGCGFDAQWGLVFPYALRCALGLNDQSTHGLGIFSDEFIRAYNGKSFEKVVFLDSHDTAANGSTRLNEIIAPGDADSLGAHRISLLAASLTMTTPGVPLILQGTEFLQPGSFQDWKELDWSHVGTYAQFVLAWKHLISLRLNRYGHTGGLSGESVAIFHRDDTARVLGFHRYGSGGPGDDVLIVANFSDTEIHDYDVTFPVAGTFGLRFDSGWPGYGNNEIQITPQETDGRGLSLAPYGCIILSQDK